MSEELHNVPVVTIGQVADLISSAYLTDAVCQTVVSLEGEPGLGKTAVVSQVAEDLGIGFASESAPLLDPATSGGMPVPDVEALILKWATDARWPRVDTHGERGILLIDELPQALPMVQAALSGLIWGRTLGSYTLPDGWMIVVTGNLKSNRAATHSVPQHIKGRLERYHVTPSLASTKAYWKAKSLNQVVLAYLSQHPDNLSTFDANAELYGSGRGWEKVSAIFDTVEDPTLRKVRIQATVGVALGEHFEQFVNSLENLPKYGAIVRDPTRCKIVEDQGDAFALLAGLASQGKAEDVVALVAYVQRYTPELQATFVQYAEEKNRALFRTTEVTKLKLEVLGE